MGVGCFWFKSAPEPWQMAWTDANSQVVTYKAMTPQCGRSVVQVLVVRVAIEVMTYEAMTPQCGRSVVQVLVVRVDIGVVTYEAMTPQCGRSVVQVLVVRVDIGVVTYEAMSPQWEVSGSGPDCQSGYRRVTYELWHPRLWGQWFRSWLSEWI